MQTYSTPLVYIENGVALKAPERQTATGSAVGAGTAGTPATLITLASDHEAYLQVVSTLDADAWLTLQGVPVHYIKAGSDRVFDVKQWLVRYRAGQVLGAYPVATAITTGSLSVVLA